MQSWFSYLRYRKLNSRNYAVTKNTAYLGSGSLDHVLRDTTNAVNMLKAGPLLHNPSKFSKQSRMLQGL